MQNTEVLGLELRFYGEETDSMVLVPRLVGQTQSSIDRKGRSNVKWTVDKLKTAYAELSEYELGRRLQKTLDWAVENKIFIVAIAISPTFGLQGKSKDRIVSFFSSGDIYCVLNEKQYPGGAEERDELAGQLKELQLIDQDLEVQQVVSGRNLTRKLFELSEDEFEKLLEKGDAHKKLRNLAEKKHVIKDKSTVDCCKHLNLHSRTLYGQNNTAKRV